MHYDEYAAFGPWVDEVTSVEQIPRLYRSFPLDLDETLLVLKVPRNIPRRDADPSMHLYDALVVVTDAALTVLHRDGDEYVARTSQHGSILAIEDSVDLLDGRLTVHSSDQEPVRLRYNGSASDQISRLVMLLRSLIKGDSTDGLRLPGAVGDAVAVDRILASERDYGLRGDCTEVLRAESDAVVLGGHSTTRVTPIGGWRTLTHALRPAFLQGSVVLARDAEISIVRRRSWVARGNDIDLSRARTFVFTGRVRSTSSRTHPVYREISVVGIGAGSALVELLVPAGSPTSQLLLSASKAPHTAL